MCHHATIYWFTFIETVFSALFLSQLKVMTYSIRDMFPQQIFDLEVMLMHSTSRACSFGVDKGFNKVWSCCFLLAKWQCRFRNSFKKNKKYTEMNRNLFVRSLERQTNDEAQQMISEDQTCWLYGVTVNGVKALEDVTYKLKTWIWS